MQEKHKLKQVLTLITQRLEGRCYAIRGTASLVLQGLEMNVDDIDILSDQETALACNEKFSEYLVDEVAYRKSPKFKSYFGKLHIADVNVEIMGNWQIYNNKKGWSRVYDASRDNITTISYQGLAVPVTTVSLELEVFALMERWTAYQKIKRQAEEKGLIKKGGSKVMDKNETSQQSLF